MKIIESKKIAIYLQKRDIVAFYKKAKNYIENGFPQMALLKKRRPYSEGIYYFRITKKYRAWGVKDGKYLKVFRIDDHQ